MKKLLKNILVCGVTVIGISMANLSSASAAGHAVFASCAVSPCVMGAAPQGWAPRGSSLYIAGWRQLSQTYYQGNQALRTLCRWHYGRSGYTSPDVANGTVPCASLCGGNPTCK